MGGWGTEMRGLGGPVGDCEVSWCVASVLCEDQTLPPSGPDHPTFPNRVGRRAGAFLTGFVMI